MRPRSWPQKRMFGEGLPAAGAASSPSPLEATLAFWRGVLVLLGWFFGALALALSGATGRSGATVWISTGVAVVTYFGATPHRCGGQGRMGMVVAVAGLPARAAAHGGR